MPDVLGHTLVVPVHEFPIGQATQHNANTDGEVAKADVGIIQLIQGLKYRGNRRLDAVVDQIVETAH